MPDGFIKGRLKETNEKVRLANVGKKMSDKTINKILETKRKNKTLNRSSESIKKQKETRILKNISPITTLDCKWYNDGKTEKMFKPNEPIPSGWICGRLKTNRKWYNNGTYSKLFDSNQPIPEGFVLGRIL